MSYCLPAWQSDHVYRAFLKRGRSVGGRRMAPGPPRTYRMLKVEANGAVAWSGEPFTTSEAISGTPQTMQFVDDAGAVVAEEQAQGYTFSHTRGGFFVVPTDVARTMVAASRRPPIARDRSRVRSAP